MKIYLAGPINGVLDEEANDWRALIKPILEPHTTIDPMRRDYRGGEMVAYREIVELDKIDILAADVVVFSYSKPSVGTSMEMLYAWENQKPSVCVHVKDAVLSPWLIYHTTKRVASYAAAAYWVREILG